MVRCPQAITHVKCELILDTIMLQECTRCCMFTFLTKTKKKNHFAVSFLYTLVSGVCNASQAWFVICTGTVAVWWPAILVKERANMDYSASQWICAPLPNLYIVILVSIISRPRGHYTVYKPTKMNVMYSKVFSCVSSKPCWDFLNSL